MECVIVKLMVYTDQEKTYNKLFGFIMCLLYLLVMTQFADNDYPCTMMNIINLLLVLCGQSYI